MNKNKTFAIGWPATSVSGWGVYALNLTLQLIKQGRVPVWTSEPQQLSLDEETAKFIKPVIERQKHLEDVRAKMGYLKFDFPVLHSLRNDFRPSLDEQISHGTKNIGIIFFENSQFSQEGLQRASEYDLIVTGSNWNKEILIKNGLNHVINIFQGVDLALFNPKIKSDCFPGRFTIFSGGKLEYRKAQDAVIRIFKEFYSVHRDALLIFAWANQWPETVMSLKKSELVTGLPDISENKEIDFRSWLQINGLPDDSYIDLKMPANNQMVKYLASADVGIFPNRCEPGTNLVAMEAMAVGLPVILSSNTGHIDLIEVGNCYSLRNQAPVKATAHDLSKEGWGEPDLDEAFRYLEDIYHDRAQAKVRGNKACKSINKFSWEKQIRELITYIDNM